MTVHTAKGLEFPTVFIAGMEEQLFPSAFAESEREVEEERRLFYVAITRAEREVYITYARQRFRNGQIVFSSPSRFLNDIDSRYISQSPAAPRPSVFTPSWMQDEWRSVPTTRTTTEKTTQPSRLTKTTGIQIKTDRAAFDSGFRAGSRVRHGTFGEGTVKESFIENGNEKIVIKFDKVGEKTLLLKFARLERMG